MQKIIDYKVIAANTAYELTELVRHTVKDGWQPFPALTSTLSEGGTTWLYQPVVKYEAGHA